MSIDLMFKQANAAYRAGDFAGAERRYRALAKLKPVWAYNNLGTVYVATGRFAEAEAAYGQALAVDPQCVDAREALGRLLMADGRYADGWPLMEARRERPGAWRPSVRVPEWKGEDLKGKRLLVYPDQGFGDQIQNFRFALVIAAAGADVTVVSPPRLTRLFEGRGVAVIEGTPGRALPDSDYWTMICSLPLHMGVTEETVAPAPYLALPAQGSAGVGVVTAGNPTHLNDRNRSLPPKMAALLTGLGRSLAPQDTGARDFRDTAEIVAGLDLVISVDTSVAHLAGAMGKPVWVLLSAIETDWRWLRGRADSPWYPSARLYRQSAPGAWGPLLRQVTEDLAARDAAAST
jgi:hypothetical protein